MKVIAVYHNKGGVGKSTTVINLAAALSKQGKRILIVDLDSQANSTFSSGLVKFEDDSSDNLKDNYIYHVIAYRNEYSIKEVVRKSDFTTPPVDVVPSHIDLMEQEQELIQQPQALSRLRTKLEAVQDDYDIVLLDTPPSLNLYAKIALITADYLLIPSDLKPFANEGLKNVRRFTNDVNEFRASMRQEPVEILGVLASKLGVVPTFVEHTLPRMIKIVEDRYGFPVLDSRIFERREVSKAVERDKEVGNLIIPDPVSVLDDAPQSKGAIQFEELAAEIMSLIEV